VKNRRRRPSSDFATIHHVVSFISVHGSSANAQMCTLLRGAPVKFSGSSSNSETRSAPGGAFEDPHARAN
jgi:hypothetical protein